MSDADIIQELGGAVGQLFNSEGASASAASYSGAAQLAEQNAQLAAASTRIQSSQVTRSVEQGIGTTQADVAGAGFTTSGSALDILQMDAQQGALANSLVNIQGAINENSYAAQAGAYQAEAKAASESSTAGVVGAIASLGGALVSGGTQLASAGNTVSKGYNYVTNLFSGGDSAATEAGIDTTSNVWVDAAGNTVAANSPGAIQLSASQAAQLAQTGEMPSLASATDTAVSEGASIGEEATATTAETVDTSEVALGTSEDAVTTGIGDFLSGAATDVVTGVGDAVSAAASIASGIGDAVAGAASDLADAAVAALAC